MFLGRGRKNMWWNFKSLFFSFDSFADKSPTVQTDKHKNIFIKRAISESRVKSPLRNQRYRTDDASTVNSDWRWMKGSFSAFDFVWTSTWYYHVSKRAERDFLTCAVISTPSDDKHSSQCWWWQGSQRVTSCQCSDLTYSCGCDCDPAFQSRTKRFFTIWHKSSPHSPASIRGERAAETLFFPSLCVCVCVLLRTHWNVSYFRASNIFRHSQQLPRGTEEAPVWLWVSAPPFIALQLQTHTNK